MQTCRNWASQRWYLDGSFEIPGTSEKLKMKVRRKGGLVCAGGCLGCMLCVVLCCGVSVYVVCCVML